MGDRPIHHVIGRALTKREVDDYYDWCADNVPGFECLERHYALLDGEVTEDALVPVVDRGENDVI